MRRPLFASAVTVGLLVFALLAGACQDRRPLTSRGYWTSDVPPDLASDQSELCTSLIDYRSSVLTLATTDLRNLSVNEFKAQRGTIAVARGEVQQAARNVKDNGVDQVSTAMSNLANGMNAIQTGSVVDVVRSLGAIRRDIDNAVTAVNNALAQRGCLQGAPSA
jgi:hypothetical protein